MAPTTPTLTGTLGLLSLFDLGQLLMMNRATGVLAITSEGRKGYLYFDDGLVVNAVDDSFHEGEGAAHKLFGWKSGQFEFRIEPPGTARTIQTGTEGLMMEAARRLDEAGVSEDGQPVSSETAKLRERQSTMEALREAFHHAASDARAVSHAPTGTLLDQLEGASDRLVYRPGHAPRLLKGSKWQPAAETRLDGAAYDEIKGKLLDGVRPLAGGAATGAQTRTVTLPGGRAFVVTVLGSGVEETLWVRPAGLLPADPGLLTGPHERLQEALAIPAGLILVGAPEPAAAERLFHAVVALAAGKRGQSLLLIADDPAYLHHDASGVVMRAAHSEARAALRALRPACVALETVPADDTLALEALQTTPLVIAAVVSADAASLLPCWLAQQRAGGEVSIRTWLAATRVALVFGAANADDPERLTFQVAKPAAGGRATRNPVRDLAAELDRNLGAA